MLTCSKVTKYKFPGGMFKWNKDMFEELESYGIHVPVAERFYPWFAVYDFEAILEKVSFKSSGKLQWTRRHKPISVSVASNVEGHTEGVCFVNPDIDVLVSEMIDHLKLIQYKSKELAHTKWANAIAQLESEMEKWKPDTDEQHNTAMYRVTTKEQNPYPLSYLKF